MRKSFLTLMTVTAISAAMTVPVMATGWQGSAESGWWYGTNADNSQWHANGWQWIDSNGDGTAECYYFDGNGYMLSSTTTPDSYQVNVDGAWVQDGVVQTKQVGTSNTGTVANGTVNGRQTHTSQEIVDYLTAQTKDPAGYKSDYIIDTSRPESASGATNIKYNYLPDSVNGWRLIIYAYKGGDPSYCYFALDPEGYMYVNTTTPDGYYVNEYGQLEIDGHVVKHTWNCWFLHQGTVKDVNGNEITDKNHVDPNQVANRLNVIIQPSTNAYAPFGNLVYNHISYLDHKEGDLYNCDNTNCFNESNAHFGYPYSY